MLTETERKEIFDVVQDYRKAHSRLADNYKDKLLYKITERLIRAWLIIIRINAHTVWRKDVPAGLGIIYWL